nr:unnamed protein product [Callosobruchus analis]
MFEFPPVGGVISSADIYSMKLLRLSKKWDIFVLICELTSYIFVFFYLLEEVREIIYFKWRYLLKFWNCIDLAIVASALAAGAWSVMEFIQVPLTMEELRENPDQYANVDYLASMFTSKNHLYAMLLFFVFMKAFKYLNFNRVMGQLSNTLKQCAKDMMYFTLMFVIVFSAYSELGYMLFGHVVEDFSNIGLAMFTLLRATLGDFQYDEIEKADKVLAPIYFLSFIYLVFFVLLNMFLAIISDTYTNVRTEIATGPDELQMSEYLRDKFYRLLRKVGIKKNVDNNEEEDETSVAVKHVTELLAK